MFFHLTACAERNYSHRAQVFARLACAGRALFLSHMTTPIESSFSSRLMSAATLRAAHAESRFDVFAMRQLSQGGFV